MTGIGGGDAARRRTPAELDALLDGSASGDTGLDAMLSAARRPAGAHELGAGPPVLPAAPAAGPADRQAAAPRDTGRTRRVLTRLSAATLVTKAVTAAAGAAVIGAAAVAGATGHLPGQHRHHAPVVTPSGSSASSHHRSPTGAPPSGASGSPTASGASSSAASTSTSPGAGPSGTATLAALCVQWLALPSGSQAAAHDPRFRVLIRAAGGVPAVTAFCRSLPSPSTGVPSPSPSTSVSAPPTTTISPRSPARSVPGGRLSSVTRTITGS